MFWKNGKVPLITECELVEKLTDGRTLTVIDVRREEDYLSSRIASSINVPIEDLEAYLVTLKRHEQIVFY